MVLQQVQQAGNLTGHAGSQAALLGVAVVLAAGIHIQIQSGSRGGNLTEVDEEVLALSGVDGGQTAAAQAGGEGLADAQGKAHSHGCVNGVAALGHDFGANLRNLILGRGGHRLGGGGVAAGGHAVAVRVNSDEAFRGVRRGFCRLFRGSGLRRGHAGGACRLAAGCKVQNHCQRQNKGTELSFHVVSPFWWVYGPQKNGLDSFAATICRNGMLLQK